MDYTLIKDLLRERGMTFQELSEKLGVDRNNLYNSLTKGNPTLQRLEAVSGALGVPVWRLFTIEPKPEIYGTIVYEGQVYSINTKEDLLRIASVIMNKQS
jgi:transcriptional regulator with XRE-family HTH domain